MFHMQNGSNSPAATSRSAQEQADEGRWAVPRENSGVPRENSRNVRGGREADDHACNVVLHAFHFLRACLPCRKPDVRPEPLKSTIPLTRPRVFPSCVSTSCSKIH
jgi:hypothetical protein